MQEMQETGVWPLGQEDPLEKEMATHSSILPGKFHDKGAWWAIVYRITKNQTWLSEWAHIVKY